jgi:hypothetical protein
VFLLYFFSRTLSLARLESHSYQRCTHPFFRARAIEEEDNIKSVFCIILLESYKTLRNKTKCTVCTSAITQKRTEIVHYVRGKTLLWSSNLVNDGSVWIKQTQVNSTEMYNSSRWRYSPWSCGNCTARPQSCCEDSHILSHYQHFIFFSMAQQPRHYRGFTITLRHTTLGRTPLDEWSARRRDLYWTVFPFIVTLFKW